MAFGSLSCGLISHASPTACCVPPWLWQFACHLEVSAKKLNPHVFDAAPQKTKQRRLSDFEIAYAKIEQFIT
jgi:hypothetical protein